MKLQYARAFIVLLAGLVVLLVNMHTGIPVNRSLLIVLAVIIVFYFFSTLMLEVLQKSLDESAKEQDENEEEEEDKDKDDGKKDVADVDEEYEESQDEIRPRMINFDEDDE